MVLRGNGVVFVAACLGTLIFEKNYGFIKRSWEFFIHNLFQVIEGCMGIAWFLDYYEIVFD